MVIGSEWYPQPKGMNGPAGPTNDSSLYVEVVEDENELGYFATASNEPEVTLSSIVELSCPFCESPIEGVLTLRDVDYYLGETHTYRVIHKVCDCPLARLT